MTRDSLDRLVSDFTFFLPEDRATPDAAFQYLVQRLGPRFGEIGAAVIALQSDDRAMVIAAHGRDGEVAVPVHGFFEETPSLPVLEGPDLPLVSAGGVGRTGRLIDLDALAQGFFERYQWALGLPLLLTEQKNRRLLLLAEDRKTLARLDPEHSALFANLAVTRLVRQLDRIRLKEANRWIDRQLDEIAGLQRLLLPVDLAEIKGVTMAIDFRSYRYAGGDYYDIVPLTGHVEDWPEGAGDFFGVMIADVSGHGPAAAVEAAMMDAILRTYEGAELDGGSAAVLTYLNRHLFTRLPRSSFITAFAAGYDPRHRVFRCVSAGHPPVFIRRGGSNRVEELDVRNDIPLRVDPEHVWENHDVFIEPGDLVVLYTDGVIESRSRSGEVFGVEAAAAAVSAAEPEPQAVIDSILSAQTRHRNGEPADDDQTIIAIRFDQ